MKLTIEYDGTNFAGWQSQNNARTVQDTLEKGLSQILREGIRVVGAGRTDAGVHARGQVAHCVAVRGDALTVIQKSLNAVLPPDIVIRGAAEEKPDFHARYGALWRRYSYTISVVPVALHRGYVWYWGQPLDIDAMVRCAEMIVGVHDFESFSKVGANTKHFRCTVRKAEWVRDGSTLIFNIEANRFLYGMVRALVGTMVEIGRGHRPEADFRSIMESRDRRSAGESAPAHGLVLEEIVYGDDE